MPRGGGGFRGGGFSGGFRGGGFRGSSASFRMGGARSSGTPFGRTGATRITSRAPRGPYRHSYYRPHRRYSRFGYRPWYWHAWYNPWWAGRWYRPWYYSPVYVGGGITIAIVLGLILLPLAGIALWFPFSTADTDGYVNYRSTETLYFNEYWYEYEYIKSGNDITYSVQSSPSLISFAIWDEPFESLPTTTKIGNDSDQFSLVNNYYEYISYFLKPGSSIHYNYSASGQIDFFIANGYDFYQWNQGGSPSFYVLEDNVDQGSGDYSISEARDYYLVWHNEGGTTVNVNITIDYSATNVIDITKADYYEEGVYSISQNTFIVPNDGDWYFFVYFDPMLSLEETTSITFDVSYDTGVTSTDRWVSIQPILITIIVVAGIVVVAALIARSGQKKLKSKPSKPSSKAIPAKKPVKAAKSSTSKCMRCGSVVRKDAHFCPNCGGKIEGRSIGTPSKVTPSNSKSCSLCGSKLSTSDKFCKWCGTGVES